MILAGDIGGTKSNLGLFVQEGTALRGVFQRRLVTRDYPGFPELIEAFLQQAAGEDFNRSDIDAAGFGVAGVVTGGRHYTENLPWVVDVSALGVNVGLKNVQLLNDLAATALSLNWLPANDFVILNPGKPVTHGTRGVIAAGTGLGAALLFWNNRKYQVAPAEAGQADFAPRTEREIQLLTSLRRHLSHVSNEEIVSGRGFRRLHQFLDSAARHKSFETPEGNAAGEITQRAMAKSCAVCVEALEFWTEIFAGVMGNFALQTMPLGGIFVGGGIAAKILPKLQESNFFRSFCGAGKLAQVLTSIPVSVLLNEDAPMLGAAYEAFGALDP